MIFADKDLGSFYIARWVNLGQSGPKTGLAMKGCPGYLKNRQH